MILALALFILATSPHPSSISSKVSWKSSSVVVAGLYIMHSSIWMIRDVQTTAFWMARGAATAGGILGQSGKSERVRL